MATTYVACLYARATRCPSHPSPLQCASCRRLAKAHRTGSQAHLDEPPDDERGWDSGISPPPPPLADAGPPTSAERELRALQAQLRHAIEAAEAEAEAACATTQEHGTGAAVVVPPAAAALAPLGVEGSESAHRTAVEPQLAPPPVPVQAAEPCKEPPPPPLPLAQAAPPPPPPEEEELPPPPPLDMLRGPPAMQRTPVAAEPLSVGWIKSPEQNRHQGRPERAPMDTPDLISFDSATKPHPPSSPPPPPAPPSSSPPPPPCVATTANSETAWTEPKPICQSGSLALTGIPRPNRDPSP
jgi:hypothetical protein